MTEKTIKAKQKHLKFKHRPKKVKHERLAKKN